MQVAVTFRHLEPTRALREHAEARVQRVLKFLHRPIEAHVVLSVLKRRHVAEITLIADHNTFNATEETDDLYSAMDLAATKLERQIKRQADKRQTRKHAPATNGAIAAPPRAPRRPRIETERIVVKPMSVDEALVQLQTTKRDFLIFQNAANETINVIYRRANGRYSLIEPEVA